VSGFAGAGCAMAGAPSRKHQTKSIIDLPNQQGFRASFRKNDDVNF